jgi:hypothetical protein
VMVPGPIAGSFSGCGKWRWRFVSSTEMVFATGVEILSGE